MVGWAPVNLRFGRMPARGYSERGRIPQHTLTAGLAKNGLKPRGATIPDSSSLVEAARVSIGGS